MKRNNTVELFFRDSPSPPKDFSPIPLQIREIVIVFATKEPVRLLLGNNSLDIHRLAAKLYKDPDAMNRITIERAFTGPQTVSLISRLEPSPSPTIIDGPLDTFFDEAIKPHNRQLYLSNIFSKQIYS